MLCDFTSSVSVVSFVNLEGPKGLVTDTRE